LRALKSNRQLPTYVIFAAIALGIVVVGIRRGEFNTQELIFLAVLVPAAICHEVSHGVVALWCGDDTAKRAGRITLNPLKHVDLVGTIAVPLILFLMNTGFLFMWAKPVPVAVNKLRHPRNQSVLVSLAGPATNVILAAITGVVLHVLALHATSFSLLLQFVFWFGIANVILAVFNLIPIPPLDGSALIERLLPASALPTYYQMRMRFLVVVLVVWFIVIGVMHANPFGGIETWYFNRCI
jgi:Zn-dependent protease